MVNVEIIHNPGLAIDIHAYRAVNQTNATRHNLEATGIEATAYVRHGCLVPNTVVDFQKGER